jgi:hypothetical protein
MFVIDLKDRTVAEFTKDELMTFANTHDYKKLEKGRFWVAETKSQAIKLIKKLIKKRF